MNSNYEGTLNGENENGKHLLARGSYLHIAYTR